jgi:hypothetical protein
MTIINPVIMAFGRGLNSVCKISFIDNYFYDARFSGVHVFKNDVKLKINMILFRFAEGFLKIPLRFL